MTVSFLNYQKINLSGKNAFYRKTSYKKREYICEKNIIIDKINYEII